ncbi:hypothetical protein H0H87_009758 [Tephrocybe sp. NHM501043]|nr:hypothetical protein H0H87_009758 [Tephrocybe sp. NHM501043]
MQGGTHAPCPQGFYPGFEAIDWRFTGVPASTFMNKTGSFHRGEWYTGPLNGTHGIDNTVGATRDAFDPDSAPIIERLVYFHRTPEEWIMRFVLDNEGPVVVRKVVLAAYVEEFRAESICGGKATFFSMTATYCSKKVVAAYSLFEDFRRGVMKRLADELGALSFDGTCPTKE